MSRNFGGVCGGLAVASGHAYSVVTMIHLTVKFLQVDGKNPERSGARVHQGLLTFTGPGHLPQALDHAPFPVVEFAHLAGVPSHGFRSDRVSYGRHIPDLCGRRG